MATFAAEAITRLLDQVGYGKDIDLVYQDRNTNDPNDMELDPESKIKNQCAQLLAYAYFNTPAKESTLIVTPSEITIKSDTITYFSSKEAYPTGNRKIYLQAHWGSGVIYTIENVSE